MIAKLVVKGKDRNDAIKGLQNALANYHIQGIKTNIPLLQEAVSHPAFLLGDTTTDFLEKLIRKKK
jgi:acetyl-CoA carboxylase, biotin carboxylase subunit